MTRPGEALRDQALQTLAETLDVEATLARVPGLTRDALRAMLFDAASQTLSARAPRGTSHQTLSARAPRGTSHQTLSARAPRGTSGDTAAPGAGKARSVIVHTDGACRGNPGRSGAGVMIRSEDGREIARISRYLGEMTNNMAEYTALLIALKEARSAGAGTITVKSDSELLVRQINGEYKVKNEALQIMHQSAMDLLRGFKRWKVMHVRREENREADRLANQAVDREG